MDSPTLEAVLILCGCLKPLQVHEVLLHLHISAILVPQTITGSFCFFTCSVDGLCLSGQDFGTGGNFLFLGSYR